MILRIILRFVPVADLSEGDSGLRIRSNFTLDKPEARNWIITGSIQCVAPVPYLRSLGKCIRGSIYSQQLNHKQFPVLESS